MKAISIADYRRRARRRLPKFVFDFIDGAAGDELTMSENEAALARIHLHPHLLVDVSKRSTSTTVMGAELSLPVVLGPTGLQRLVHPEADLAAARAAGRAGTVYVVSSGSAFSVEEIADVATGPLWFQLYLWRDRSVMQSVVRRAQEANYAALVVTIDACVVGTRERDLRNGMTIPPRISPRNLYEGARHPRWALGLMRGPEITFRTFEDLIPEGRGMALMTYVTKELANPSMTWADLAWLRGVWDGPIIVKGVMTAHDATRAVKAGADGLVVSNHGGRQLDGVPASVDVLPRIVEAVPHHIEVLMDGGVRRGIDVMRAVAHGARAVLIGRPYWWGLAVDGETGVTGILEILRTELDTAMALAGRPTIASIGRDLVDPPATG